MKKIIFTLMIFLVVFSLFGQAKELLNNELKNTSNYYLDLLNVQLTDGQTSTESLTLSPLNAPFDCGSEFFVTLGSNLNTLDPYDFGGGLTLLYNIGQNVNAIGYNVVDDFIYAITSTSGHLLRLHSDATVEDLGDINLGMNPFTGSFDLDGNYYVTDGGNTIAVIDVVNLTFTTITPNQDFDAADWAYHIDEGKFYGAHSNTLYSFDPGTNTVSTSALTGLLGGDGTFFGAAFYFTDGYIYVWNNTSGNLYQVDVNTSEANFIFSGPNSSGVVDGTSCPNSPPPDPLVVAENDTLCLELDGSQSYFIIDNDDAVFAELDYSTFSVILDPEFGSVSFDDITGELVYTATDTPMQDSLVYEICSDGTIVVCDQATIYINPPDQITFEEWGPYCQYDDPDILTGTSNEGITGYWEPDAIDTDIPGTFDHTFFPDTEINPCAYPLTISVTVIELETPSFDPFGPYCQFEDPTIFPDVSNEGINGYWIPDAIDTDIFGDFTFTFIPDDENHPCALESNIEITVYEEVLPTFDPIDPYCLNSIPGELPFVSNEGIFGSWVPAVISTEIAGDISYVFTPDETLHPCALQQTIVVMVQEPETPVFGSMGPYCVEDIPEALPEFSVEGIPGEWYPDFIDTSVPGEFQYTFIPDVELYPCALEFILNITIEEPTSASFNDLGPFCQGDVPPQLAVTSLEGITGSWAPAEISTDIPGITEYFFIPDDVNGCIQQSSIEIMVLEPVTIELIDKNCSDDLTVYDLDIQLSGGSGNYVTLNADSYGIMNNGDDNYTVTGIGSGSGLVIEVIDDAGCSSIINVLPYDCNCPNIPDPTGMQDLIYCAGTGSNMISIDDPGPGYQVNWYDDQGALLSNDNPYVTPGPGLFMVTLTDLINGCESSPQFINVSEIPLININLLDVECSADLQSYDLDFLVSGGTGNFSEILADGYNIIENGSANYTIQNVMNASGVNIQVTDDQGCTYSIYSPPHDCDCSFIDPPVGDQLIYFCFGEPAPALFVDDPGNGYDVQWYDSNQNMIATGITLNGVSEGIFYAEIIDITNNCTSGKLQIELIENSEITTIVSGAICENETTPFNLHLMVDGGSPGYVVTAGNYSVLNTTLNEFIIENIMESNGIELFVQDNSGCQLSLWAAPEVMPIPIGNAGSDQVISCIDLSVTLQAEMQGNNYTCIWAGPDPELDSILPNPIVNFAGMYHLTITDINNGCQIVDSVNVMDPTYPEFEFILEPLRCHDEQNGMILFQGITSGAPPYFYSIDDGYSFTTDPLFNNLGPGQYELILKDDLGCTKDTSLIINNPDSLELNIESPIELIYGEEYQIEIETNLSEIQIASINWFPDSGLSCTDCLEPLANPAESTTYVLELTDILGCMISGTLIINRDIDIDIFIPNIFSPNGDAVNDVFYIKGGAGVQLIESLDIYSRWGNHLFSSGNIPINDASYGWDGTYQGERLFPAVFVYLARIKLIDGSIVTYSGDITLIR